MYSVGCGVFVCVVYKFSVWGIYMVCTGYVSGVCTLWGVGCVVYMCVKCGCGMCLWVCGCGVCLCVCGCGVCLCVPVSVAVGSVSVQE